MIYELLIILNQHKPLIATLKTICSVLFLKQCNNFRRIYPVIILTRGPLTWNWEYIKSNSVKVFSLATLPWIAECLSTAFFTHILLGFPWYWGKEDSLESYVSGT